MKLINKAGKIVGEIESGKYCIENIVAVEDYMFPRKRYEIVVYDANDDLQGKVQKIDNEPTKEQILYALSTYGDIYSSKAYVNEYYELSKDF